VISVGAPASGEALRLLSGTYTLRPLRAGPNSPTRSVIVGPGELKNRRILRFLKRAYEAGATVGVTRARPSVAMVLGRAIGAPELGFPYKGPLRAELVAFRQVQQGGRTISSASVLMPQDKIPAKPAARKAGIKAADQFARNYLVGVFSATPTLPAPPASGQSIDLLKIADAYQTSIVREDNSGHAVQIVNTFFSARSFTNRKDVYYVQQEIAIQGSSGVRCARPVHHIHDNPSPHHGQHAETADSGVQHHREIRPILSLNIRCNEHQENFPKFF
jgi:hypothetical protein